MNAAAARSTWDVIKTCLVPDIHFSRSGYFAESIDGIDAADCWHFEFEWLSLYFSIHGGRMRPARRGAGQ